METASHLDFVSGVITGGGILLGERRIGQMQGTFADEAARVGMEADTVVYRTYGISAPENTDALLYSTTVIEPGKVGREFFMTRGHFHHKASRGEFCLTLQGEGSLILMDRERNSRTEKMAPGSIHNIDGAWAHRVANTSSMPLVFLVTWLADCGHDYASIEREGFSTRLIEGEDAPKQTSGALRAVDLFESEQEVEALIRRFEQCELTHEQWTHSAHVSVAAYFCFTMPPVEALNDFRIKLERLNATHGVVQTIDRGYHETLTRFWMAWVRRWINAANPKGLLEAVNGATTAGRERYAPLFYYTRDRVMSWDARTSWVEPDLATFSELEELS